MLIGMRRAPLFSFSVGLWLVSIGLQLFIPVHWDTLYLLQAGARLGDGGSMLHDVFDPNPPLIFYFSAGVHVLAGILAIPTLWLFSTLQYLSIVYALGVSHRLLPGCYRLRMVAALAFCLLILPVHAFAEREQWMLALSLPYLFLLFRRGDAPVYFRIIVSLFAAIGCCLKPYFFISVIAAGLFAAFLKPKSGVFWRLEFIVVGFSAVLYAGLVGWFLPEYYTEILPQVLQWYVPNHNGLSILYSPPMLLFYLYAACFIAHRAYTNHFVMGLMLLAAAFAVSYVLQGKGWLYQAVPLLSVLFLLVIVWDALHSYLRLILLSAWLVTALLPAAVTYYQYQACFQQHNCVYQPLRDAIQQHTSAEDNSVFFLSTLMSESQPSLYYAKAQNSSRFSYLWLIPGVINRAERMQRCDARCKQASRLIRKLIVEDFVRSRPALVFVDVGREKVYFKRRFDYLQFMRQSKQFNPLWAHYRYVQRVGRYAVYKKITTNTQTQTETTTPHPQNANTRPRPQRQNDARG